MSLNSTVSKIFLLSHPELGAGVHHGRCVWRVLGQPITMVPKDASKQGAHRQPRCND